MKGRGSGRVMKQKPWELFPGVCCVAVEEPWWTWCAGSEHPAPGRSLEQAKAQASSFGTARIPQPAQRWAFGLLQKTYWPSQTLPEPWRLCDDCGIINIFRLSNIWSKLQNSLLALLYAPEASSVCQNGCDWGKMLGFYSSLLVGWAENVAKNALRFENAFQSTLNCLLPSEEELSWTNPEHSNCPACSVPCPRPLLLEQTFLKTV